MEFMAIEVLLNIDHTYRHDLESFFHVFIWQCARRSCGVWPNRPRKQWVDFDVDLFGGLSLVVRYGVTFVYHIENLAVQAKGCFESWDFRSSEPFRGSGRFTLEKDGRSVDDR
ncbi:hypothetical protein BDFG_09008 [Blastomyces dermatitidis ATCC 26199]|nr:hypothetical protein BDFG_09008 [Blastomyces dermatitidis ATCC 26199]